MRETHNLHGSIFHHTKYASSIAEFYRDRRPTAARHDRSHVTIRRVCSYGMEFGTGNDDAIGDVM